MPTAKMQSLAEQYGLDEMYQDAQGCQNRFVCEWLSAHMEQLSTEAKKVLEMASKLVEDTMSRRALFNEDNENYQIMNFDCGWYQVKAMLTKNELDEFKTSYKALADKMRPMVYELGFLK